MPARKIRKTLDEWRGHNYSVNYDLRQQFKTYPPEMQLKYASLAYSLPPWKLNRYGCPVMDTDPDVHYEHERAMIKIARQGGLPDAFLLCIFYTSDEGWNEYVRLFNELPLDETFPRERIEEKQAAFSPQVPVDN